MVFEPISIVPEPWGLGAGRAREMTRDVEQVVLDAGIIEFPINKMIEWICPVMSDGSFRNQQIE